MFASNQLLPNIYVPTFEISVEGQPLELDIARSILEVSVTERLAPPNQFSFRLNDPTLKFINREKGRFTEGKRIEISLGFVGNTRKMIVGEISALAADFPNSGPATLEVQGFDLLHRLTRGTVYRRFGESASNNGRSDQGPPPNSGLPDSEIVIEIAKEMGLKLSFDATLIRTEARVQNHMTDLVFLEELARVNGYFLWVEEDTLFFKQERPIPSQIQLEWRRTLMSFSPRLSTAGQVNAVEVRGWDPRQKQSFSARVERSRASTAELLSSSGQQQLARGNGGQSELVITDMSVVSAEEARKAAERILEEQQQTTITGNGTSVGQPDLQAGTILDLSGMGRFNGSYQVTEVTHTVSDSGYQTSFQVNNARVSTAPSFADRMSEGGSRSRSRYLGVFVGTVLSNQDREDLGRVFVKLPELSDAEIGHWARLSVPMAGAGRGFYFVPEVNDEVLVAFEQGDITRPYILGSLWNGQDKPPAQNQDGKNNLRLIRSRSGHEVRFDDKEGAEKIEIIDQSGDNKITIGKRGDDQDSSAIAIQSNQDISIEALKGTIKLNAKNIEIASSAETKVQAKGGMNLDGAPGDTNIKGKIINLN